MKSLKFMLTALGLLCLSVTALAQSLPSYVPANGLVGWWPFNGNANDESGNGNNGTVNGASLTSDRFGNAGNAFRFDGVNDYGSLNTTLPSIFSISFWFKVDTFSTYSIPGPNTIGSKLISTYNNSLPFTGLELELDGSPNNYGIHGGAFWCNPSCDGVISNTPCDTIVWCFVIATYDGNKLRYFVNGNLVDSSISSLNSNLQPIHIAARGNIEPAFFLNGKLDDIGLWNRALSQQEITNLYNASTSALAPCPALPVNLQNGLVGYWPFCGNANDESGNGNNGTSVGAVLTSDRFGNSNKAYKFNGLNFTRIQVANNPNNSLNLVNDLSISSWFKADSMNDFNGTVRSIVMKSGDGVGSPNGYAYGIWAGTPISTPSIGVVNFQAQPFNNALTYPAGNSGNVTINQWYNFVVTYRKSDSLLKYYINGILIDSKALKFEIGNNNNELWIGSQPSIYTTTKTFKGALDDIAIWNRALDSTEITQLYQTQSSNSSMGNVGINVVAPQRNLHIKDVMRLEPRNTAPENPVKGDIYFDGLLNKLRVYDGTAWQNCW